MVETIPDDFVSSWGFFGRCTNSQHGSCRGVTETLFYYQVTYKYYCAICYDQRCKFARKLEPGKLVPGYTRCVRDAKFKCPEGKCNSSLSFREFIDDPCCTPVRSEFQDITKMMKLLEISEKKDKKAKQEMELKQKRFEDAILIFSEKDVKRRESRKELAASFATAEAYMMNFDKTDEKSKFEDLKNLMNEHEVIVKEQEDAEKKMESEKTAFEEASNECSQKKEECDKIRSELSSSFSDAAQSLAKNQEVEENPRDKCNVCFEKYNTVDRHFCVLHCGHPTCQKCLIEMPEKHCPICREPFTENNIIKLFFN